MKSACVSVLSIIDQT